MLNNIKSLISEAKMKHNTQPKAYIKPKAATTRH